MVLTGYGNVVATVRFCATALTQVDRCARERFALNWLEKSILSVVKKKRFVRVRSEAFNPETASANRAAASRSFSSLPLFLLKSGKVDHEHAHF